MSPFDFDGEQPQAVCNFMYLGINAFSHDSSAALIGGDGRVIAAVEEERFTRRKKESRFPTEAISFCLRSAGISSREIMGVGLAWNPWLLFRDRLIREDILSQRVEIRHLQKDIQKAVNCYSLKVWLEREIGPLSKRCKVNHFRHHLAHAASAFFGSSFENASFLTVDGRGERETTTWGTAIGTGFQRIGYWEHPNSLGNFYTGLARFCGFFNSDLEGTAMAFAGCGKPTYTEQIRVALGLKNESGLPFKILLNTELLNCESGDAFPRPALAKHLGIPHREPDSDIWNPYPDVSASVQAVLEEVLLGLAFQLYENTKITRLVFAGGVALNSVANGRLMRDGPFKDVYIQPAAHDAGLALGCGFLMANEGRSERLPPDTASPFYGPSFNRVEILTTLERSPNISISEPIDISERAAESLAQGAIVGWFQGKLEFGPRALGNRSILADPRDKKTTEKLNRIKGRQKFRPFAVAILHEKLNDWLQDGFESPHMLIVDRLRDERFEMVPAARHVDGSVRTQTVQKAQNPLFHAVITSFYEITGVPLLVNTSLNVGGEPLACSPDDAIRAFLDSEIDALAIGTFWIERQRPQDRKAI